MDDDVTGDDVARGCNKNGEYVESDYNVSNRFVGSDCEHDVRAEISFIVRHIVAVVGFQSWLPKMTKAVAFLDIFSREWGGGGM